MGSAEEIRDNSLSYLCKPLKDKLEMLKVKNFFLVPSANTVDKINEIKEYFRDFSWDFLDKNL